MVWERINSASSYFINRIVKGYRYETPLLVFTEAITTKIKSASNNPANKIIPILARIKDTATIPYIDIEI
jgi:hypothetical protein